MAKHLHINEKEKNAEEASTENTEEVSTKNREETSRTIRIAKQVTVRPSMEGMNGTVAQAMDIKSKKDTLMT